MVTADVELGILGPTLAIVDGAPASLSARRLRSLLAALVLWRGQATRAERLIDVLWQGAPSPGAANTLQGYVASLRRTLEPQRRPRAAPSILLHEPGGYRLDLGADQIDAERFESAVDAGRSFLQRFPDPTRPHLTAAGSAAGSAAEALQADLAEAMGLWRGEAYADLEDFTPAATERRRLETLLVDVRTADVVVDLTLGRSARAASVLEELITLHPLREQLWGMWAVALVRNDRQAHALEVLGRLRTTLADELGIDPSPQIARLHEAVLRQDPSVLGVPASPPAAPPTLPAKAPPISAGAPDVAAGSAPLAPNGPPFVGRDRELKWLQDGMRAAAGGHPQFFLLWGEAGVGKSRLTTELVRWVRTQGLALTATVRNVESDSAPPLWALLRTLGELSEATGIAVPTIAQDVEVEGDEAAGAGQFALDDQLATFVRHVARARPLLLVVEDAHWSDPSTLRVVRHLVEHALDLPLMVVITRRSEDETAAAAALSTTVTRCGGTWVHLQGLTSMDVRQLADHLTDPVLSDDELKEIQERSGGNPLFVSELLRAAGQQGSHLPASLAGLVHRRLQALPDDTARLVQVAALLGREFTVGALALATDSSSDLLPVIEPARLAGILRERTGGTWTFAHALVRDAVVDAMRPSERGGWHARIAASLDSTAADAFTRSEVARHWRAAGPHHAAQAWRSTASAAGRAHQLFAFHEEAGLLAEALASQRVDASSTDLERFDLLERRATACRLSSDWDQAATAVIEAIAMAERMDRPELAARAATSLPEGSIWHVQRYGTVSADLVHALHRCLALADPDDVVLRCRLLLTIAQESYYIATHDELDTYVEQALAIADEVPDPELQCLALQQAYSARWRPGTVQWRIDIASRGLGLARAAGSLRFEATCGALHAIALVEAGRLTEAQVVMAQALDLATRQEFATVVAILELLRVPLKLLAGRDDEASASLRRVVGLQERITGSNLPAAIAGSQMLAMMWQGRASDFVAAVTQSPPDQEAPIELTAVLILFRLGLDEAAHAHYASMPALEPDGTYMGMLVAAVSAEVALHLGRRPLSERMYEWLQPYSGGVASAGSTAVLGPVDAFLALAAAGSGRPAQAAAHAESALEQCSRWGMSRATSWLSDLRERYHF
ncbi:AAA family ATPase [Nocardioides sp. cx-169]|uniref:BTAD domain-containing putative transcriptional regulator n=1 Tax=Nocardioides sp. cx-169 TaxID=2899080 RepID=UPI001E65D35A|nr:BTAD domain-containing putative transcriptional regulator [Nocardioides sp. cx-169]MCD4532830.1 AAA family ATPase [Nocardioides sp. cx-169]